MLSGVRFGRQGDQEIAGKMSYRMALNFSLGVSKNSKRREYAKETDNTAMRCEVVQ